MQAKPQRWKKKLKATGVKAKAYQSNAGDFAQSDALVNDVLKEFGTVDICVNNAGISKDNLLLRMSSDQWDDVIATNLKSVFNMTKQVIRPMMKAKSGSIINMSSIIGISGNAGQSSYAASKARYHWFYKSIAKEMGSRNIRWNAIAPGFIETDMTGYLKKAMLQKKYKSGIPSGRLVPAKTLQTLYYFLPATGAVILQAKRSVFVAG